MLAKAQGERNFAAASNNNVDSNKNSSSDKNLIAPPQSEEHSQGNQKQQQEQIRVKVWTDVIGSLIKSANGIRKQKLSNSRVLSIQIERQSLDQPWGLGFVSTNQKLVKTFDTNYNNHQQRVRYASLNLLYGTRILIVKSPGSIGKDQQNTLLPGDILLGIDGKSISSFCGNTATENITGEIASYLRSIQKASMVVLRHLQATLAVSSHGASKTPLPHEPYRISYIANAAWNNLLLPQHQQSSSKTKVKRKPIVYRNPWFWRIDENGNKVYAPYEGNEDSLEYWLNHQEEDTRSSLVLPPIPQDRTGFCGWLSERKKCWRSQYKVYKFATDTKKARPKETKHKAATGNETNEDFDVQTNTDFWTHQGFSSFDDWIRTRSHQWHRSYSWNKRKRQKIEEECFEKVVALPLTHHHTSNNHSSPVCSTENFHEWLTARRVQWKMSRRKRKRQRLSMERKSDHSSIETNDSPAIGISESPSCVISFPNSKEGTSDEGKPPSKRKLQFLSKEDQQMAFIDEILEEQERKRQELLRMRAERPPIDILRFFDATKGIPDDVVAHCLAYIEPREHGKLFTINKAVSKALQDRHGVWQTMCPSHWILPRRPRKPWHEIYLTRLRKEYELHQKRWDDLLVKCSSALFKRDDLQKVEKLITNAEKEFGFDLNYSSGVVCERNSILNLAVIHGRYKVVRWLVDTKHADIETADRGNFTPLLNAAWSGDRWLVRFFLQRRANRMVKGTQHYTKGIAPPGFEGRTAEGWAEHRGHPEIAKLIKLGL